MGRNYLSIPKLQRLHRLGTTDTQIHGTNLLGIWLIIHAEIYANRYKKKDAPGTEGSMDFWLTMDLNIELFHNTLSNNGNKQKRDLAPNRQSCM